MRTILISVAFYCSHLSFPSVSLADDLSSSVLSECLNVGSNDDEIHNCLDNFLDVMDNNMRDIELFIRNTLDGDALAAFESTQQAFVSYREENCLWYLTINEPRDVAEQIAKDCLVRMSEQRIAELQQLITGVDASTVTLRGHLIDLGSRRVFQACSSTARYQLSGDSETLAAVRQYIATRSATSEPMEVVVLGELLDNAELDTRLQGLIQLESLSEVLAAESEVCPVPDMSDLVDDEGDQETASDSAAVAAEDDVLDDDTNDEPADSEDNESDPGGEALVAYFGGWQADCTTDNIERICLLSSDLLPAEGPRELGDGAAKLQIQIASEGEVMAIVRFPDREIDSPQKFIWQIDNWVMGDIVGSSIRVDEEGSRQLVDKAAITEREILSKFILGVTMSVTLLENVDDETGEVFEATLNGVGRALDFANDYVQ